MGIVCMNSVFRLYKKEMKKIAFITRKYTPSIWGMENYCRDLVKYFRKSDVLVNLVAHGWSQKWLPIVAFKFFFVWLYHSFRSDAIWIGDGAMSLFWLLLSKLTGKPWYITIHALDITRKNSLYQKFVPKLVASAHGVVAVSEYTRQECIRRWIPNEKITVIPNGIDPDILIEPIIQKSQLFNTYSIPQDKKILFSIGRHIERKWIHWFLQEVFSKYLDDYVYVIAWSWPWTEVYRWIVEKYDLDQRVFFVWRVSDEEKFAWYTYSDRFLMPNVYVGWDAEWFGIVCIEAWWYWCPVIASDREGISDAVIHDQTWYLVQWYDVVRWANEIDDVYLYRNEIHDTVKEKYSWGRVVEFYLNILE